MDSTRQALEKVRSIFGFDEEKNKEFLEKGLSIEDKERMSDDPKTVGEIIDILSKLPKDTKVHYDYSYLSFFVENNELYFVVGS